MRIQIVALAGMLLFPHAHAVDQLIKLPKPGELAAAVNTKPVAQAAEAAPPQAAPVGQAAAAPAANAAPAATTTTPAAATASPATSAGNAVAAKDTAALKEKIAASDAAAASAPKQPQRGSARTAHDEDEENIQLLAERISTRLAALRKEKESKAAVAPSKKTAGVVKASHVAAHAHRHWSYEGEGGPSQWSKMNPAWAQCESGSRQSPIDIRDGIRVDLEPVAFDYHPSRFNVLDNGRTIQVNVGAGNAITVTGHTYELEQFHFHLPSEERINGQSFPMVLHLVHKDARGRLAIVAVLVEEGTAHGTVQQVWNNLPLEKNDPLVATSVLDLPGVVPARREYYTYMGSLTTPPCSEGVLWIVLKAPIQLSSQQIGIFSRLYPMNARPIQAQAGRLIKESN